MQYRDGSDLSSVPDPWNFGAIRFGADPDADPRIRTSDYRMWMRIRTKIFSDFLDAKNLLFSYF